MIQGFVRSIITALMVLFMLLMFLGAQEAFGQNNGSLPPWFWPAFPNSSGSGPAANGFVCTTTTGTTTPLATYSEQTLTTANANPITLNSAGRPVSGANEIRIYLQSASYRFTVYAAGTGNTCNGTTVGSQLRQVDNVYDYGQMIRTGLVQVAIPSYAYASLPAAGTAGRLARVNNLRGGIWMDGGTQWAKSGVVVNAADAPYNVLCDGTTNNQDVGIQAAINANPGATVLIPASTTHCLLNDPLILRDGTTLAGEGGPGIDNATVLEWTTGDGIHIEDTYSTIRDIWIYGPRVGTTETTGSDPEAGTFGTVGISLSGVAAYNAASGTALLNVGVSHFNTGIRTSNASLDSIGGSYFHANNIRLLYNTVGMALTDTTTDFRGTNFDFIENSKHGLYVGSATNVGYRQVELGMAIFELAGTTTLVAAGLQRNLAGIRADGQTSLRIYGGYLENATVYAGEGASISLDGMYDGGGAARFFGEGKILVHDVIGVEEINVSPVDDMTAAQWTCSNCTVASVDTAANPHAFTVTSTAVSGTTVQISSSNVAFINRTSPRQYSSAAEVIPMWMEFEFWLKYDSGTYAPASPWSASGTFWPILQIRNHAGAGDSSSPLTMMDTSAIDFTDGEWHRVQLFAPIRFGTGLMQGSISVVNMIIQFRNSASSESYDVTPLSVRIKPPRITLYDKAGVY